jgi:hypothetical protein
MRQLVMEARLAAADPDRLFDPGGRSVKAHAARLSHQARTPTRVAFVGTGMLALSAACFALLTVSGLLGGRLTHRFGVRVADVTHEPSHRAGRHDTQPESGYR